MKAIFTFIRLSVFAIGFFAIATSARAQGFGPLIAPRAFSGDIHFGAVIGTRPVGMTTNVKRPLDDLSQRVVSELNKDLPKAGLNFRGFRPYDIRIVRSARPVIKGLVVNDDISLEYLLPGNSVSATFTTPDIVDTHVPIFGRVHFGADRAADPRITLTFDLVVRANVTPQLHGAPKVRTVSINVQNAKLKPANLSARVLNVGNDFVSWVSGKNFRGLAEKAINAQGIRINDPLSKSLNSLNPQIATMTRNARSLDVHMDSNRINVIYSTATADRIVVH